MKQGLDPIENESCETLILGSLPGDISIKLQQYYAHPRNHFWHIVAAVDRAAVRGLLRTLRDAP